MSETTSKTSSSPSDETQDNEDVLTFKSLLTGETPWWGITLRGMGMGAADVVPGISGGTMALILGIYTRFIGALSKLNLDLVKAIPGLFSQKRRPQLFRAIQQADLMFLVFLGIGIVTAIASFAKVIPWLIDTYPAHMNGFFFGMILASTLVPFRMMDKRGPTQFFWFLISTAFAFWFSGLPLLSVDASLPFLFVCGAIAICAMMLPGVSGSFLLLILGQYKYVLGGLRDINIPIIAVFGGGCAFGLLAFSRVLSWLLKRFRPSTLAALCGLMIGSVQKLWPFKDVSTKVVVGKKIISSGTNVLPWSEAHASPVLLPLGLLFLGIILVFALEKIGGNSPDAEM